MANKTFCKSKTGFTVKGFSLNAYDETVECNDCKEALKTILTFMDNPNVCTIRIWNNDTGECKAVL